MNLSNLSMQDAAQFLGVSIATLKSWEEKGWLTPVMTDGQRVYSKQQLESIKNNPLVTQAVGASSQRPQVNAAAGFPMPHGNNRKPNFIPLAAVLFAGVVLLQGVMVAAGVAPSWLASMDRFGNAMDKKDANSAKAGVLAANDNNPVYTLRVAVPAVFGKPVTFLDSASVSKSLTVNGEAVLTGGVRTNNASIDAGTGQITASNVVYSITAGTNVTLGGDPQNPVINANLAGNFVSTFQGQAGAVALAEGDGIGLDGLTITNTGVLSLQGQSGALAFNQGAGIALNGLTITNSDPGSAQKIFGTFDIEGTKIEAGTNTDTFTFAAGSGVTLSANTTGKILTISATGAASQWTTTGSDIYYDLGNVGIGNTSPARTLDVTGTGRFSGAFTLSALGQGIVKADATGLLSSSALDLASAEVTGVLPIANGGIGLSSIPTNGQLLIGNGSGYTLGAIAGTANQITIGNGSGSITISTPQDIHTAATPTFASLTLENNTNQITFGSGTTGTISMDTLTNNRTYIFPDLSGTVCLTSGNCSGGGGGGISGFGTTNYLAKFTSSSGISDSSIFDNGRVGIGTTSPEGLLTVSGGPAGKALAVFNYTGSGQDILTASASGSTRLVLSNNGNLNIIGGAYNIGGTSVLSNTTLGSGVVNSSLTGVGTLASGSITSTFGNIDVGMDSISGGDITSVGGGGFVSTGNGAGLTFSGTGNHDITAASGVLRFGAAALTGAISGNSQNITGLNNLSATGTVTFGGLGTGVVQSNGSGVLSSAALNLAGGGSYVTGTLPTTNGGTGLASFNTGDIMYASAGNTLAALPIGTEGQVLAVSGAGTPTWISTGSLNYWQRSLGAVAPINITDDLLIGGVATSSAKFQVFGITGNASTSGSFTFNAAGVIQSTQNQSLTIGGNTTGNITLSPLNGSGTVISTGDLNLSSGKAYMINGANVLTATTLGSSVVNSSLNGVGTLASGSIANGFGSIATGNTITGTTINGTAGLNTGAGAGTPRISSTGNLVNIGTTQFNGVTYTWPAADGSNEYVLTTNSSGSLSWVNASTITGVGDITAVGDATSGSAFTAAGTSGTSLYFYDAQGRGQLTIANLTGPQTYTLPDASGEICLDSGNCAGAGGGITGAGTAGQLAFFDGGTTLTSETTGFMWDAINKKFGLGTDTPEGKLSVSSAATGKALVVLNETGNQNILTASASGTTVLNLDRTGNLAIEGQLSDLNQSTLTVNDSLNLVSGNDFQINGTSVLTASTLGSAVINSSLTSVGALASGSIANGFGSIFTTNTIQGSNITASGTTGFTASGNGAGLTFSGTGNHSISASSGTLQIGAHTLTGAITGNSQSITGVNNFSASGTVTFSGLSTGIVKSDGSGVLSSSAVNLGTADITGTLGVGNGGTGAASIGSAGAVAYSNGSAYAFTGVGTSGQVLVSNGTGSPTWADASGVGTNYWQRNGGLLAPLAITDDLAVGGIGTSSAKFQIFGLTGNATTSGTLTFNAAGNIQTTNNQTLTFGGNSTGNILFSPLNGAGTVMVNGSMNLSSSSSYNINGATVLTATTLGSGVVNSSLTNVGALSGGSIANGFGIIATANTITGTTLNGTTGINTGASAGTQRIDASGNLVNIGTTELNGVTYTWPAADGSIDYVLTTDSNGVLTWKNVTAVGGAGDITAIGDVTSGAAFTAAGTQGTSLYFYDADGRGQLTTANLTQARTFTLPDASGEICILEANNCGGGGGGVSGTGTAGQIAFFNGAGSITSESTGFSWDATNNKLGIGTDSPLGKFQVTGSSTGKALAVFDETGDQDILTASASGVTQLVLQQNGNLAIEGQISDYSQNALTVNDSLNLVSGNGFQINGTSVLNASTLGANVLSSSLTSVGSLSGGSISSGFGTILTTNTIQGSDITASGTTGFTASGNGAGLTFSGTGNHIVSASSGTLQIGAATLTGTLTGNSQNITGVNNFGAGGTITFGGLSTGIVKSNGSGVLSSSAVNLASADVTGTLAVGNGGTGQTSFTSNGVVYGNGSSALSVTSAPTGGQVLIGNGSGVPTFMSLTGGVTVSNTGVTSLTLSSSNDTVNTSSNSGLEFSTANGLSLLRGCTNDQILKWDDTNKVWQCASDQGGSGSAGIINVESSDTGVGSSVDTLDFNTDFVVTASPSNEANVSIADDVLDFTEIADNLALDAATSIALSNFDLTIGNSNGNGTVKVTPNAGGAAALIVDKQGSSGDILTASASGVTRLTLSNTGNLNIVGGAFQIGGTTVLGSTALGSGVVGSSLTSVGALNSGSITSGFGAIDTGVDAISGGDITSTGTSGFAASGNGAGLLFSGSGNHDISASAGTLRLGAATLLGSITGNNQSITGLNNLSAAGTITFSTFSTNGGLLYTNGSGQLAQMSTGSLGQCLQSNGGAAPVWGSCADGSVNWWDLSNGALMPKNATVDLLVGGTSSSSAKFAVLNMNNGTPTASVSGTTGALSINATGNIQTTNNQTITIGGNTSGNITLSPLNGNGTVTSTGNLTLASGKTFQINGTGVLSDSALGTGVTGSSLTSVGNLNAGSIVSGFGSITTANAIQGTDIIATGTTGFSASGNGAGITFSGTGNHDITASSGVLRLGAVTLNGAVSGNNQNITGLNNLAASGTVTFGGFTNNGGLLYTNGSGVLAQTSVGGAGECLQSNGGGSPIWGSCAAGSVNWWDLSNGALMPKNATVDLLVGGTSSSSAKFAVLNMNNGTPTASVSGAIGGVSLTATGVLGTTNKQSLTLGNASTGNIVLNGFGAGPLKSNASGVLSVSAIDLSGSEVTNTLPVARGGTGQVSFTANGVVYGNGTSALSVTSAPTGGQVLLGNNSGVPTFTSVSGGISLSDTGVATIALTSANDTANASSNSGLEFSTANGLSLLRGCGDGQVLKWNESSKLWECGTDAGGAGAAGTINVENNDGAVGSSVDTIDFSTDFTVGASPSTEANVSIADDVLNFTEFADSLGLDAATVVALNNFDFTLGNNTGNGRVVVAPNAGGSAALIVNKQSNAGDIFTASASGTTRFVINNAGDMTVAGNGTIQGTTGLSLTGSGADLAFSGGGTNSISSTGTLEIGAFTLTGGITGNSQSITGLSQLTADNLRLDGNTLDTTSGDLTIAANGGDVIFSDTNTLNIGGNGNDVAYNVIGDNTTGNSIVDSDDDLFIEGNLEVEGAIKFDNSSITLGHSNFANCSSLETSGGVLTCGTDDVGSAGTNYFQMNNGTVSPFSNTLDLLVGGTSTQSAKFAFINTLTGTPTASIAGSIANVATSITGNGAIGTTNAQSLTLGTSSTGNVLLAPGGNTVLTALANGNIIVTGTLSDSDSNLVLDDTVDLGSASTGINITTAGVISDIDGNVVIGDTVDLGSAANGLRVDTAGTLIDINGNIVLDDIVDLGSATTGINVTTAGAISDIDGNLVLADTVDLGSAANGIRIDTSGNIIDIDGNIVLNDTTDIGSSANGIRIDTAGNISDINGNVVINDTIDLGSATTGLNITTAGAISDIDGNISLNDNTSVTGTLDVSSTLTLSSLTTNGGILYTNGTGGAVAQTTAGSAGQCLLSNGSGAPTWGNCGLGNNLWQVSQGAMSPYNTTLDLLVGSNASSSAKFAVLNMTGSGTPTASVSATSTGNGVSIAGDGVIQSFRNNTLTIGGGTTGNVLIDEIVSLGSAVNGVQIDVAGVITDLNGNVVINDAVDLGSASTGINVTTNGVITDTDGNVVIDDTVDLGSSTNGLRVDTAGTVIDINGNIVLNDAVDLGSASTGLNITTAGLLSDIDGNLILGDTVDLGSGTTGLNVTTAGVLSDIDGNVVLGDTVDIGSASTGVNVTTAGILSDIDGNLVLADTIDLGSASTGINITTAGLISDIDGNVVIGDTVDLGSSANGIRIDTAGAISDINANVVIDDTVDLGSAANGINITTAGVISDNNGNISLNDNTDVTGTFSVSSTLTLSSLTTNGGLLYTNGSGTVAQTAAGNSGECLKSAGGGSPTWGSCTAGAPNFWQINSGAISPFSNTLDLLVGGTSTQSAKFAFINTITGTPTASVAGTTTNVATSLDGNGNLGTTNKQTLNLGTSSTGNVVLAPGGAAALTAQANGNISVVGVVSDSDSNLVLDDTVDIGSTTTGLRVDTAGNLVDIDANLVLNDTVDLGSGTTGLRVDSSGNVIDIDGNIVFNDVVDLGSATTGLNITTAGVISDTDGNVVIGDTVDLGSAANGVRIDSTGAVSDINANLVLDDTLDLGSATTGINITTAGLISDIDGNVVIGDTVDLGSSANGLRVDTAGTVIDINGNIVLDDTVDLGSAANGIRIDTAGNISDINGNVVIGDTIDLGSATTGLNITTAGAISDTDGNISLNDNTDITGTLGVSSTLTLSSLTTNGGVLYTNGSGTVAQTTAGSAGQCLVSIGGGAPTWGNCATGNNLWQVSQGAMSPYNTTLDMILGSAATNSAKFAVTNMTGSGTPTASVSATSTGNGISIAGDGVIQSFRNNTLTIGGGTTGNVLIDEIVSLGSAANGIRIDTAGAISDLNGDILLDDAVDIGSATTGLSISTTGVVTDSDGNVVIDDTVDLGNASNGIRIDTSGNIIDIDGNIVLNDTVDLGSSANGLRVDTAGNVIDINGNIVLNDVVDLGSATTGLNITAAGVISDTDGDVVIGDQVALGSSSTGVQVTTAGAVSDLDGNLVLADTTDIGSAANGIRIDTAGAISDINANIVLDDVVDIGSATTGLNVTTAGVISDIDGNVVIGDTVDLGSAANGIRIDSAGTILDINGNISLNDNTDITGTLGVSSTVTFSSLTTNGGVLYTNGSGTVAQTTAGSSGQCLMSAGGGTPTWGVCGGQNYWQSASGGVVSPYINSIDLLVGGVATNSAKFAVTGMVGSNTPVASLSATTASGGNGNGITLGGDGSIQSLRRNTLNIGGSSTGNINLDPLSGNGTVFSTGNFSIATGKTFQINGSDILTTSSLIGVTTASSLVTVGTLNSGAIGTGFGAIDVDSDNIRGGTLTASSTTGFISTGTGSGLTFQTGTGNHLISASAGTLQLGAVTLTGTVTGGAQSITGLGQVTVDNTRIDGNTIDTTSGDLTLAANGGDIIFTDANTINIGGNGADVSYNVIGDSTATADTGNMNSDDDLYIEGALEVDGQVTIGSTTDGITFTAAAGPTYFGTARPTKTIVLSAEYPGAVLTASSSANTNGQMTSDASTSATLNFMNYYEWNSSQTSVQDYTVAVRVQLPSDFSAWATTNAIVVDYNTELASTTRSYFDLLLRREGEGTPTSYRQAITSGTNRTWTTLVIDDSDLTDGAAAAQWATADQTAVIFLKMYSRDNNHVQIGDITLNYLRKN